MQYDENSFSVFNSILRWTIILGYNGFCLLQRMNKICLQYGYLAVIIPLKQIKQDVPKDEPVKLFELRLTFNKPWQKTIMRSLQYENIANPNPNATNNLVSDTDSQCAIQQEKMKDSKKKWNNWIFRKPHQKRFSTKTTTHAYIQELYYTSGRWYV